MASNSTDLSMKLLRAEIEKRVHENLGSLGRELGEFTKGMSEADAKAAKIMLLTMVQGAAETFCNKMRARIDKNFAAE
jgi:hypothetical protein